MNEEQNPPAAVKKESTFKDLVYFVIIILVILIPLRFFVAEPFVVVGTSMDNTFKTGQYLIVDELTYHLRNPERGEVIIFHPPIDPSVYYIKRVIGLPGETVDIVNGKVTIINSAHPNGFVLNEPYVSYPKDDSEKVTLGAGQYFVMGDNRAVSYDSRAWGPVPRNLIAGRAFLRLLPLNAISILPGYDNPEN